MQKKESITHASAKEIKLKLASTENQTDWKAALAMPQFDVEMMADEEDGKLPDGWENNIIMGLPPRKKDIHIRLDTDLIDWFKAYGTGYQTRINAVLRSFVQAKQQLEHKQ